MIINIRTIKSMRTYKIKKSLNVCATLGCSEMRTSVSISDIKMNKPIADGFIDNLKLVEVLSK